MRETVATGDSRSLTFLDPNDVPRRACEVAVAELRYGRPVIFGSDRCYAAMALETSSSEDYERFAAVSEGTHSLYLTPERARVLRLPAPDGAILPLRHATLDRARDWGYGLNATRPAAWSNAPFELSDLTVLSNLALLLPVIVVAEIEPDDRAFAGLAQITSTDIKAAREADTRYEIVARTRVPLRDVPKTEFVVFRGGLSQRDQIAVIVGDPDVSQPVPTRIHSSCVTGDLFGSLKCDCGDQLHAALRLMATRAGGVLLYLDQEGRSTGIGAKMRAYGYQSQGLDTIDADAALGFGPDSRRYDAAVAMLDILGVTKVELLTNNPSKGTFLEEAGIAVSKKTPVLGEVTKDNQSYLTTKAQRAGHSFDIAAIASALVSR